MISPIIPLLRPFKGPPLKPHSFPLLLLHPSLTIYSTVTLPFPSFNYSSSSFFHFTLLYSPPPPLFIPLHPPLFHFSPSPYSTSPLPLYSASSPPLYPTHSIPLCQVIPPPYSTSPTSPLFLFLTCPFPSALVRASQLTNKISNEKKNTVSHEYAAVTIQMFIND